MLTVTTCDGGSGGSVSWTGGSYGAGELIIEPGNILRNPVGTDGTDSLPAGDYTYEFRDGSGNHLTGGTFSIVECPPPV